MMKCNIIYWKAVLEKCAWGLLLDTYVQYGAQSMQKFIKGYVAALLTTVNS